MKDKTNILAGYQRVVIKISSGLLVDDKEWTLRCGKIKKLAEEIASLSECDVVIVSSGAIGVGRSVLEFRDRRLKSEEKQAAAAAGQMALSKAWDNAFADCKKKTAQMLLTLDDTEDRQKSVGIGKALSELLNLGVIPIVNENNTVTQINSGHNDNDRLAARVATMIEADLVLLLGDIDGLYDGNPELHKDAKHIPIIEIFNDEIMNMAQDTKKLLTSGGMATKLQAAKIAAKVGADMIIAKGEDGLTALTKGGKHSLFKAEENELQARKKWISGALRPAGSVTIDDGAVEALIERGKSLLLAGVKEISGNFKKGDTVDIVGMDSVRCAVGLAGYDSDMARQVIGKNRDDAESILGKKTSALIHRNDLVIL